MVSLNRALLLAFGLLGYSFAQETSSSSLGTLDAQPLPERLDTNSNSPWGDSTAESVDPFTRIPNTGRVRRYNWTIRNGTIAPDGVQKTGLLVNGQFPGPTIQANWGDTFEITVKNELDEGTHIHWHGMFQKGTPWADGKPGVTMCPIAPGKTFTYRFRADQYGTSWWHGHYQAQYADGLFGPMIVYGPRHARYDIDLGPIMLSDHWHQEYKYYVEQVNGVPFQVPSSDNNLINGKAYIVNGVPGTSFAKFRFRRGRTHRLRLINSGAEGLQHFAIDGHEMTVVANDFVPVEPYKTDVVTLGVGQRTDILVRATGGRRDAFWMRSNISSTCSLGTQPFARAAIYYDDADDKKAPTSVSTTKPYTNACVNEPLDRTKPLYRLDPPRQPAATQNVDITLAPNATGNFLFYMNGQNFRANYNHPPLLLARAGNVSYPDDPQWNVYDFGSNSSIRMVFRNYSPVMHPMHLHGHDPWILAEGYGEWDGRVIERNPPRRDVHMMPPMGPDGRVPYLVMEWVADNPGIWGIHCHVAWHSSTGLYLSVMEQTAKIRSLNFPPQVAEVCRDWSAFTNSTVVDQIDSGLRKNRLLV